MLKAVLLSAALVVAGLAAAAVAHPVEAGDNARKGTGGWNGG
jgi:hypothetical protein